MLSPATISMVKKSIKQREMLCSQPPHTQFQAREEGVVLTLYLSGKMTLQGKRRAAFFQEVLSRYISIPSTVCPQPPSFHQGHIGSDETGKGDFFGPLVVTALSADTKGLERLKAWGVRDSKQMKDRLIVDSVEKIKTSFPYYTLLIPPEEYNAIYPKYPNLNHLLAALHVEAISRLMEIDNLPPSKQLVIIDRFAPESTLSLAFSHGKISPTWYQYPKAESLSLAVAAASMIARADFLKGWRLLEDRMGYPLPKGAGPPVLTKAREILKKEGFAKLDLCCKKHFSTYTQVQ
ncbi:MAG: ribonuclease HIII [Chlamydiota bacterium]|nr:ribonuclease HIII [Chlamydiota bacterium]